MLVISMSSISGDIETTQSIILSLEVILLLNLSVTKQNINKDKINFVINKMC